MATGAHGGMEGLEGKLPWKHNTLWKALRRFLLNLVPQPISGTSVRVVCSGLLSLHRRDQKPSSDQVWNIIIHLQLALYTINLLWTLWSFGLTRSQEQVISFTTKADVVNQLFKNYFPLSAVILELKKIMSVTASTFPLLFAWSNGIRCHDLSFSNVKF